MTGYLCEGTEVREGREVEGLSTGMCGFRKELGRLARPMARIIYATDIEG